MPLPLSLATNVRRRRAIFGALALGVILAAPCAGDVGLGAGADDVNDVTAPAQIQVKRRKIVVPPPTGMVSVMGQDWMLDGILQSSVDRDNYLEAIFIPAFIWDNFQQRRQDDQFLADFAVVQTQKRLSFDDEENCERFGRLGRAMHESFVLRIASINSPLRQVIDAGSDGAARSAASSVDLDESRLVPLSILRNDDQTFSAVCATRYTAMLDGHRRSWMMVVGFAMVLTKDRIVYLYKYKRGPPDPLRVSAVRRSLAQWTIAVLNANAG